MMTSSKPHISIYHNPRCSKSRKALQLLKEQGLKPEIIEYLKVPLNREGLDEILKLLDLGPRDLMRKKEKIYEEKGLTDTSLSREQLLDALIQHPILIERPIVLANGKAALGRPPEAVLGVL